MKRKLLSLFLAAILVVSLLPMAALAVEAESPEEKISIEELPVEEILEKTSEGEIIPGEVTEDLDDQILNAQTPTPYLTYDAKTGTIVKNTTNVVALFSDTTGIEDGWYYVDRDLELGGLDVRGEAHLILKNNCTLTVTKGIDVPADSSLTVYAQSSKISEMGTLIATGESYHSGIGAGPYANAGTITINGGNIEAFGGFTNEGIGGGSDSNVIIGGNCSIHAQSGAELTRAIGKGKVTVADGFVITNNKTGEIAVVSDFIRDRDVSITADFVSTYYLKPGDTETTVCTEYRYLDPCGDLNLTDGWYLVRGERTVYDNILDENGSLVIRGNVTLILENNCRLNVAGIYVTTDGSLTIYAQSAEENIMGHLISNGKDECAGIGGIKTSWSTSGHGDIIINGGFIEATGGYDAAGIGGGKYNQSSWITINGGKVIATGGNQAAGIGGGHDGHCNFVTINGGYVEANGNKNAAGIGGGYAGDGGSITIKGGEVRATGGESATGIGSGLYGEGGDITLGGGVIHAFGGDGGVGIGGGDRYKGVSVRITGCCTVEAKAKGDATHAIGKGMEDHELTYPCTIQIDNGFKPVDINDNPIILDFNNPSWMSTFSAKSVYFKIVPDLEYPVYYLADSYDKETGINVFRETECENFEVLFGGNTTLTNGKWYVVKYNGEFNQPLVVNGNVNLILMDGHTLRANKGIYVPAGSSLTIYGQSTDKNEMGKLIATGEYDGAGIGSGNNNSHGTITINGGYVEATGGDYGAGIGSANEANGGNIIINGGIVKANGGIYGAGIGGGYKGNGGTVTVNGGVVIGNDGKRESYGGNVEATGGYHGAGIGGGDEGNGGTVIVNGGVVIGNDGNTEVYGGYVKATGGYNGAGIGGGYKGNGGNVTLAGGNVEANGGEYAAGIGGGFKGTGGNVKIAGSCTVIAEAGNGVSRAIGSGEGNNNVGTIEVVRGIAVTNNKTGVRITSSISYFTNWLEFLSGTSVDFTAVAGKISYYVVNGKRFEQSGTIMTDEAVDWADPWYVVSGDCIIRSVDVIGNVSVILEDGCNLNVVNCIHVEEGSSLTIYAQSTKSGICGRLESVSNIDGHAGIGSRPEKASGNIIIYGGNVIGRGGKRAAGIGGGSNGNGTVTIYNGSVLGYGGEGAAGIGGGYNAAGIVKIYGGTVTGQSKKGGGAGIGGGAGTYGLCNVLIDGNAIVSAEGGTNETDKTKAGPGIGCSVNGMLGSVEIKSGSIHAKGGSAIKATTIFMNPNDGYAIKLTTLDDGRETYYPTSATVTTLSGKSDIYIETVEKTSRMEDWTEPTTCYKTIAGVNATWTHGSSVGLVITSEASFETFVAVKVDGKVVDASNYTVEAGSTKVTLKEAYLNTLSVGAHKVEIISTDGYAETSFTIERGSYFPNTGDESNMMSWLVLLLISGAIVACLAIYSRKRNQNNGR